MDLTFSAEQEELRGVVRAFLRDVSPEEEVRRLMETPSGYDPAAWTKMSDQLGLQGLAVPEDLGGAGAGPLEVGIVAEEMGRALSGAPFLSTCVLAVQAILAADDPGALVEALRADAARIAEAARAQAPEADIRIEVRNSYPGLGTDPGAEVVAFVGSLAGAGGSTKVAFGTEGGLFAERLGVPTVVCGPGSMAEGHRPDESVAVEQIARCDAMLDALLDRLATGI